MAYDTVAKREGQYRSLIFRIPGGYGASVYIHQAWRNFTEPADLRELAAACEWAAEQLEALARGDVAPVATGREGGRDDARA